VSGFWQPPQGHTAQAAVSWQEIYQELQPSRSRSVLIGQDRDIPGIQVELMLASFRETYPMGSIITELLRVEEGIYIVKAQVAVNTIILGTGLAGASRVEEAEEAALKRALSHAGFSQPHFKPLPYPGIPTSNGQAGLRYDPSSVSPAPDPKPDPRPEPRLESRPEPRLEAKPDPKPIPDSGDPEDLSEIIAQTSVEMERVGWTATKGREYIKRVYGKEARSQLTREELRGFLQHLRQQPTPSTF